MELDIDMNPPNVLERTERIIGRFMHLTPDEKLSASLWILHTYIHKKYLLTPRLAILSPWYGHGKSTMLDLIERLSFNSFKTVSATPPVIFRVIGNNPISTTMLLDEGDNQNLRLNADYRKILNANRRGDMVDRVIGKQVIRYNVFAPIAIAAVHDLYPALMQRSVIIYLLQPPADIKLEVLPQQPSPQLVHEIAELRNDIELWSHEAVLADYPLNPVKGRLADNWRVLLAIADNFDRGDDARRALTELVKGHPNDNPGAHLLSDLRDIYDERDMDRIFTKRLLQSLHLLGWNNWTGLDGEMSNHALTERELAGILRRFKIYPTTIRQSESKLVKSTVAKGYYRKDFEYAWSVYCPQLPVTALQRNIHLVEPESEPEPEKKHRRLKGNDM
jgi:hypothetical protein